MLNIQLLGKSLLSYIPYIDQTQTKIRITKDSLLIDGVVSVESWERPIQTKLVKYIVKPYHIVAEFGYGLGMASDAIQKIAPREHWIFEKHYQVLIPILDRAQQHKKFFISPWQKVLPLVKDDSFDSIIYDADPVNIATFDGSVEATLEFISPILTHTRRILTPGGSLGFIDFSGMLHKHADFQTKLKEFNLDFEYTPVHINPPSNCSYAKKGLGSIIKIVKK